MRDEETGTWWQQVSGKAINGPLKGRQLKSVFHDEISFAIWKREAAQGRVLKPDDKIIAINEYAPADWEAHVGKMRVVDSSNVDQRLEPRTLVIGITVAGKSKAYPLSALQKQSPIIDVIGSTAIVLVLGDDHRSVRAFERTVDGRRLEFFQKTEQGSNPLQLVDVETNSTWNFAGRAIAGPLAGRELKKVSILEDYWFDWRNYHPDTSIYTIGAQ